MATSIASCPAPYEAFDPIFRMYYTMYTYLQARCTAFRVKGAEEDNKRFIGFTDSGGGFATGLAILLVIRLNGVKCNFHNPTIIRGHNTEC